MFPFAIGPLLLFSAAEAPQMRDAKPVWAETRTEEMNLSLEFRAIIPLERGNKTTLRFMPSDLPWCEGTFYTPDGPVTMSWKQTDDRFIYDLSTLPKHYTLTVENQTGKGCKRLNKNLTKHLIHF